MPDASVDVSWSIVMPAIVQRTERRTSAGPGLTIVRYAALSLPTVAGRAHASEIAREAVAAGVGVELQPELMTARAARTAMPPRARRIARNASMGCLCRVWTQRP